MKKYLVWGLLVLSIAGVLSACETTGYTPRDNDGHGGHSH